MSAASRHSLEAIAARRQRAAAMRLGSSHEDIGDDTDERRREHRRHTDSGYADSISIATLPADRTQPHTPSPSPVAAAAAATAAAILSPASVASSPPAGDPRNAADASATALSGSYLSVADPTTLVTHLPTSSSFEADVDDLTPNAAVDGADTDDAPTDDGSLVGTDSPTPTHSPEIIDSQATSAHASHAVASSQPKKDSRTARIASFFTRRGRQKQPAEASTTSTMPAVSNSIVNILRSNSSDSIFGQRQSPLSPAPVVRATSTPKPTVGSATDESEQEFDDAAHGAAAAPSTVSPAVTGPKRSIYTQKLIHLSHSLLNMFSSSSSSAQPTSLMTFSQQAHTFTNSPAWILGRVHKLLGTPPKMRDADVASSLSVTAAARSSLQLRRARFLADFHSQIWCTYRKGFPAIATSSYTSDAGWGCMIRSAQMMLAQVFMRHELGRDWRRPETGKHARLRPIESDTDSDQDTVGVAASPDSMLPVLPAAYLRILSLFLDSPAAAAPYSIHNLLLKGQSSKDKKVGEWFGPHNACWMMKQCMEGEHAKMTAHLSDGTPPMYTRAAGFGSDDAARTSPCAPDASSSSSSVAATFGVPKIYVSDDGTLYLDKIMQMAHVGDGAVEEMKEQDDGLSSSYSTSSPALHPTIPPSQPCPPLFSPQFHPLVILIPLRLGSTDKLNPSYIPSLLSLFQFPQCLGIIGGKPRASLYFIGVQDEHLFYLDPHTVQRASDLTGARSMRGGVAAQHAISATYHCANVLSIPVRAIDPSLAIGFYISSRQDMNAFWEQAKKLTDVANLHTAHGATAASLPVFHVADVSPNYDGLMDSEEEEDDDDDDDEPYSDADADGDGDSDTSGDFESARQAHAAAETALSALDSPVPIHTSSLPKDHFGRPLNMDSLTTSPVMCPQETVADKHADSLCDSVLSVDSLVLPESDATAATDAHTPTTAPADDAESSSSVSGIFAFSAAAASRLHSSAKSLSDFAVSAASQAQDGLAHLAAQAQQLQQASIAAAQRKLTRDTDERSDTAEDGAIMTSPVAAADLDLVAPPPPPPAADSASAPPLAPTAPATSAAHTCSTSTKPLAALRRKSTKTARMRSAARKSSRCDEDDEFVWI